HFRATDVVGFRPRLRNGEHADEMGDRVVDPDRLAVRFHSHGDRKCRNPWEARNELTEQLETRPASADDERRPEGREIVLALSEDRFERTPRAEMGREFVRPPTESAQIYYPREVGRARRRREVPGRTPVAHFEIGPFHRMDQIVCRGTVLEGRIETSG